MDIVVPNNTPESVITHAAIAPWAGFIYQGLCALCVAMEKLLQQPQEAINWYLNVEGCEDFAILNGQQKILSLHQCKNYKNNTSMTAEFMKMEGKRSCWYQKGKCDPNVPMYFHTNINITYSHDVQLYKYRNSSTTSNALDIYEMLYSLIDEYCTTNKIPTSAERVRNRLVNLIEKLVCSLDGECKKKTKTKSNQQISIDNSIPFSELVSLINSSEEDKTIDEKIRTSIFYINLYLIDRLDNKPQYSTVILPFLDHLNGKNQSEQKDFIKRLFPYIDIDNGQNATTEISNSTRANYLFNLLTKTKQAIDYEPMNWKDQGVIMSPSTMGNDIEPEEYCHKIVENQSLPPEILRDYDWLVGDFDYSVGDIIKASNIINRVADVNYDEITKPHRTGLLSINDKNDGNIH